MIGVHGGKRRGKQRCKVQKSIRAQRCFIVDLDVSAGRRQHPTGIFSRLRLGPMTVTAPSSVLGRQMTRKVLPCSG